MLYWNYWHAFLYSPVCPWKSSLTISSLIHLSLPTAWYSCFLGLHSMLNGFLILDLHFHLISITLLPDWWHLKQYLLPHSLLWTSRLLIYLWARNPQADVSKISQTQYTSKWTCLPFLEVSILVVAVMQIRNLGIILDYLSLSIISSYSHTKFYKTYFQNTL